VEDHPGGIDHPAEARAGPVDDLEANLSEERGEIGGGDLRPLAKESQELLSVLFEGLPDRLDHHPPGMRLKKPLDDQLLEHFIDRGDLTQDETRMLLTDSHVKPLRKET
jgi:hypothetical protein